MWVEFVNIKLIMSLSSTVFPLVCLSFLLSFDAGDADGACRINDARHTRGICRALADCPSAIAFLKAGVKPTSCPLQNTAKVCCPIEKRISSEKCDEFKKILTQPIKVKQALVYDGAHSEQKKHEDDSTIKCENFLLVFISGGTNARLRQFPYQVALGYGEKPDWRCGGTLIDPLYILTAAHCIRTTFGPPTMVLLGDRRLSTKRDPSRIIVNVSEIYLHPNYKPPLVYNDIAIVKLESPVTLSRAILPACLPEPALRLDRIIGVEATGWGRTGAFDDRSDALKSVTLARFDTDDCASIFRKTDSATKDRVPEGIIRSQFCAGDKHGLRDTCQGDSGGPITVEDKEHSCIRYLIGITSFGSNLCGYQQPGVYTNVLSYLDWIEDIVWRNLTIKDKSFSKYGSNENYGIIDNSIVYGKNAASTESTTFQMPSTTTKPHNFGAFSHTTQISFTKLHTTSESAIIPSLQRMNERYGFLNISSTIANLLNKFSLG